MRTPPTLIRLVARLGLTRYLPRVQRQLDGGADYLRFYSSRLLSSELDELQRIGQYLDDPGPGVIDLTQGAPAFDAVPSATTRLPGHQRGWPPLRGLPELRQAVAERLLSRHRVAFHPAEDVLITSGGLGAIQTALDAFVNRGDRVVLMDPSSPIYPLAVRARHARVSWLTTWGEEGRLRFRLHQLAQLMRDARMIVVTSPSNPTGSVIAPEDLEQIAWWAHRHDVLILSDEVYASNPSALEPVSIATLDQARPRTLVLGSVSKSHALASARVGWLAAGRHLLRPCVAAAALRTAFVPVLSQQVAQAGLRAGEEALEAHRGQWDRRRCYGLERLRGQGLRVEAAPGSLFLWVSVEELGMTGSQLAERALREHQVLVTPGELFGPSGAHRVRLSCAVEDGRFREGLARFTRAVTASLPVPIPVTALPQAIPA